MQVARGEGGYQRGMTVLEMISSHPLESAFDPVALAEAIESAVDCAQACTSCADACLAEESPADLRDCIRRDLDCADVCAATAAVLSRQNATDLGLVRVLLEACTVACKRCAAACEDHAATHVHCGVCADACRRCEAACRAMLEEIRDAGVPQPEPVGARDDEVNVTDDAIVGQDTLGRA